LIWAAGDFGPGLIFSKTFFLNMSVTDIMHVHGEFGIVEAVRSEYLFLDIVGRQGMKRKLKIIDSE
jgi:hypothetical protein